MVSFTTNAIQKIKELSKKDSSKFFRVRLKVGGCNGMEYEVSMSERLDTDKIYSFEGTSVVIDDISDAMLAALSVDYVDTIGFSGFKFENPDAKSKCGCGQSFSL